MIFSYVPGKKKFCSCGIDMKFVDGRYICPGCEGYAFNKSCQFVEVDE